LTQLQSGQAVVLARLEADRSSDTTVVGAEPARAAVVVGKISGIVFFDPAKGQHLLVQPQEFKGNAPPIVTPAPKPEVIAYPTPVHTIFAYSVGEFVTLETARGALLAFKML